MKKYIFLFFFIITPIVYFGSQKYYSSYEQHGLLLQKLKKHENRKPASTGTKNDLETRPTDTPILSGLYKRNEVESGNIAIEKKFYLKKHEELRKLSHCLEDMSCPFPNTDLSEMELMLDRELAEKIKAIHVNAGIAESSLEVLMDIAESFIFYKGIYTKEAALSLFSQLPPDERNIETIIEGIKDSESPEIFQKAIVEFARYEGEVNQKKVFNFLSELIKRGPFLVSSRLPKYLSPVLNSETIQMYETILDHIPRNQERYKQLYLVIEEKKTLLNSR